MAGGDAGAGAIKEAGGGDDGCGGAGGDFVVKALTALQALAVLEPVALTFQ